MWSKARDVWNGLSTRGRAAVLVALIVAIAGLLAYAMHLGLDLTWLPGILAELVGG